MNRKEGGLMNIRKQLDEIIRRMDRGEVRFTKD